MKKILAYLLLVTFSSYSFAFGLGGGGMGGASDDVLTSADEGILDAGTLDTIDSLQFLRSDASDTASGAITFTTSPTVSRTLPAFVLKDSDSLTTAITAEISIKDSTSIDVAKLAFSSATDANLELTNLITGGNLELNVTSGIVTSNGNLMWNAGNDGPSSGLDADTVDGVNSASFLRSDQTDSASGDLTFSGDVIHTESCASTYTRVGVNKCMRSTSTWNSTYLGSCTPFTAPDASAVSTVYSIQPFVKSNNAVGVRSASLTLYSDSGCTTVLDSADILDYEQSAIAGNQILGSYHGQMEVVLPSAGATIYGKMIRDAGGNSNVYWREKSYTD